MYDSDLTDTEWALIAHHFEPQDRQGTESIHDKRNIANAILYLNKSGAQWLMLPKEYPNWKTVYDPYRRWNQRGVWEAALDELNQIHRKKTVKEVTPSYGIVDSQSAKTASYNEVRGIDGGKKVEG